MSQSTSIAIVGMSCRLSGNVSSLNDFWTFLSRSRDGWCSVPTDRISSHAFYHPDPQKQGCFNQKGGYFMKRDFAAFDAPFFHISAQEAEAMDPQQRQLLECTYEALENAGIPMNFVAGRKMGVFIAGKASDYKQNTVMRDPHQVPLFSTTGNEQSIQAARISYFFDLRGPCFTIDTACSSSLHALHLAVQSIRCGDADSAIVGGCSLHLQPDDMIAMSMLGIFNNSGRTFAFDHRAESGFAQGEGVGCLILKPLEEAIKDRDKIRSIIVNTGVNHDGRTVGLSLPNGNAQEQLIREVYAQANASLEDVGFVEAHGTGTKIGDPIEANAINRVFGSSFTKRSPLYMGTVKTNFGHLENASGIISVIKASLILEKGFILPNINFEKTNQSIPLDQWNIKIPRSIRPWPKSKRFISINNFGFGGSNAHAVLERHPTSLSELPHESKNMSPKLIVLSGHDEGAAKRVASQLGIYMEQHPEVFQKRVMRDMAYTLGERRSHLPWRIALTAVSYNELVVSLNAAETVPRRAAKIPRLAFVFTGQGAQWPQMGVQLLTSYPIFSETLKVAGDVLIRLGADFSLLEELNKSKDDSNINEANISQPICTAVQIGLTALLSSWGIRPSAVIGHSNGEIGAAYAADIITLEDAMTLAYHRGQVALKMKAKSPHLRGAMLAVGADPTKVTRVIQSLGLENIIVACENSPSSTTASGDEDAVDKLAAEFESQKVFNRKLRVDIAYHSPHMQLVADDYESAIKDVTPKTSGGMAFYSSLLSNKIEDMALLGPSYWVRNLSQPVHFSSALRELYYDQKPDVIVEIGPHSALEGPIKQTLRGISQQAASGVKYLPSLVRNQHATRSTVKLAGHLFVEGHPLRFDAINHVDTGLVKPALITDFSPYPWSDHKYWFESRVSKQHRLKPYARHDLLGLLEDAYGDFEPIWRNILTSDSVPWLKCHRMQTLETFPLAGYLCMAVEAAFQRAKMRGIHPQHIHGFRLREIQVTKALILDDDTQYETIVSFRSYAEGTRSYSNDWDEFRISSWMPARGWLEHCRGLVAVKKQCAANSVNGAELQAAAVRRENALGPAGRELMLAAFYAELESCGAGYSSVFALQPGCGLTVCGEYSTGRVVVPNTRSTMPSLYESPSILPTAFMDLLIQFVFPILGAGSGKMPSLFMPSSIREVELGAPLPSQPGEQVRVVAHGRPDFANPGPVDFVIDAWQGTQSEPIVKMTGFRMTPLNSVVAGDQRPRSLCYEIQWQPLKGVFSSAKENGAVVRAKDTSGGTFQAEKMTDDIVKYHTSDHPKGVNGISKTAAIIGKTNGIKYEAYDEKYEVNGTKEFATVDIIDSTGHNMASAISRVEDAVVCLITERHESDQFVSALVNLLELRTGSKPMISSFSSLNASEAACCICLVELDTPLLYDMSEETFKGMQKLLLTCSSILWVSAGAYHTAENPEKNIVQGLLRTVRSELSKSAATLDLDPNSALYASDRAELVLSALKASLTIPEDGSPVDYEFAEESGSLVVPRVVEQAGLNLDLFRKTQPSAPYPQEFAQPGRRMQIAVGTFGALNSLYWKDETERSLADDEIEIKVAFTGMNFKDVVIAMGQVASPYLGVECSGIVARVGRDVRTLKVGDRVCAMSQGAYSTYARCAATSAALVPEGMSFEIAATIPVVYSTAYYSIFELAGLKAGEKILIHAASGGVGQAAVQLSQMIGAEIYATVGSAEKKHLLLHTYGIPEDHIFYSRDTAFGPAVREATGGEGVDVVINSLAGDLLRESWECLAPFGHFVEIGKRDITSNTRLEMAKFDRNCSFSSVDLTLLAAKRPKIVGHVLNAVLDLLASKTIRPVTPIITVAISDVETALRKLQSGKTSGKVVVSHLGEQRVKATHPSVSTNLLQEDATYLVIGGTGGLGRSVTKRMAQLGARHVVLVSRSDNVTNELVTLIQECQAIGASIYIHPCDVADEARVASLVAELQRTLRPIRGIIHAAMVLKDVLFEQMTFEEYQTVVRSKVSGAWNFHKALLDTPLQFFIVLSSVAGIVGNKGQAAYAAANTFLDAFTLYRRRKGLVASSLDLTAVEGAGYLAANIEKRIQVLKKFSGNTMDEFEVLALVEAAIEGRLDISSHGQCITGLDFKNHHSLPYYAADAKFSHLRDAALANANTLPTSISICIGERIQQAPSMEDAREIVIAGLRDKLGAILMLSPEVVAAQQATISGLGLDSLNAIELRNWIGKELQAHLQVLELLTGGGLKDLAALVLRKTKIQGVWSKQDTK